MCPDVASSVVAAPAYAYVYMNQGDPAQPAQACTWRCNAGYYADSGVCVPCVAPAPCDAGQYLKIDCATTAGVANPPKCMACPIIVNAVYASNGSGYDAHGCGFVCNPGYYASGVGCAPVTQRSCGVWSFLVPGFQQLFQKLLPTVTPLPRL